MKNWKTSIIKPLATILETIKTIDNSSWQIGLVADKNYRLLGTVTDGDIRRAILGAVPMDTPIEKVMFTSPTTVNPEAQDKDIIEIMRQSGLRQIPVVDKDGIIKDLKILVHMIEEQKHENCVLIMAGGFGSRLRPLTDECPKPLLQVGSKPVLETILHNFKSQGFKKFFISINYMAEKIQEYFQDGSQYGLEIQYLKEDRPLGTAGALSLIPDKLTAPFIVMNGDLLTTIDINKMLRFHQENKTTATMGVRSFQFQVPYGVVNIKNNRLSSIEEKPVQNFFVNAGVYTFEPEVLDLIPSEQYVDMPTFFDILLEKKLSTSIFPIHEYWMDIGKYRDYQRANGEYDQFFE